MFSHTRPPKEAINCYISASGGLSGRLNVDVMGGIGAAAIDVKVAEDTGGFGSVAVDVNLGDRHFTWCRKLSTKETLRHLHDLADGGLFP